MKNLYRILSWLIAIILPTVIVLTVVKVIINPWYPQFEYHTPGFPADSYGFSLQDRLKYAKITFEYIINSADISFLSDLRFPSGQQTPQPSCQFMTDCTHLYNDRELEHMIDVKNVYRGAMLVWEVSFAFLLVLAIWAWRVKWLRLYLNGLKRGGILTLALLGLIVLSILTVFNYFFVIFHELFFKSGTWTFLYSDTLIRLFPERFFQDTFLIGGILSLVLALIFFFGARTVLRKY